MRSRLRRASARSGRSSGARFGGHGVVVTSEVRLAYLQPEARFRIFPDVNGTGTRFPVRSNPHMTAASPGQHQGARARAARPDAVRDRPRRLDRQRRAAVDRPRARLQPGRPLVGRQRLHPHLRRLPAARRAPRRPPRPPPRSSSSGSSCSRSPRSLGGLAQSDVWLIAARGVQGLGAAIISPAALSLVTTMFAEGAERNRALGVWGAVAGSGGAAGVLLGGILTEYAGLGVGAVRQRADRRRPPPSLAPRLLPESRDAGTRPRLRRRRRDHRHRRPRAARLRARRRQQRRLGLDADARPRRDLGRSCSSPSSSSRAARATRSCRSRSSACARCAARTSSAC